MNIIVTRKWFTTRSTISECQASRLLQDNTTKSMHFYGLEPPKRETKPYCIPVGTYHVNKRWSDKHNMLVPGILDVPNFEDIEIHPGNFGYEHEIDGVIHPPDTKGCLCVAFERGSRPDFIETSRPCFKELTQDFIFPALENNEEVWITYMEESNV